MFSCITHLTAWVTVFTFRLGGGFGCSCGQRLRDPWHREQHGGGDPLPLGGRKYPVRTRFPSRSIHHGPEESCSGWAKVSRDHALPYILRAHVPHLCSVYTPKSGFSIIHLNVSVAFITFDFWKNRLSLNPTNVSVTFNDVVESLADMSGLVFGLSLMVELRPLVSGS